jgi:hypothetical protein
MPVQHSRWLLLLLLLLLLLTRCTTRQPQASRSLLS